MAPSMATPRLARFTPPVLLLLVALLPFQAPAARLPDAAIIASRAFKDVKFESDNQGWAKQARESRGTLKSSRAARPPLGWSSWNHFRCNVNEDIMRGTADALVSSGLAALGYTYVNIDDCWSAPERDAEGRLQSDPVTFPSGIKALADYMHSRGLKLGIYSDAGFKTCSERLGSLGHEQVDANTFAEWGIDYLKYDNCFSDQSPPLGRYITMRDALNATGRDIVYSMCEWGVLDPATWARGVADLWRTTEDIKDRWNSMLKIATINDKWAKFAGPGGWNDPDMLQVGNGHMTTAEYRVHFGLWAIMKAPLLIGTDVRKMSAETASILGNAEIIKVNQDALGVQAQRVRHNLILGDVWAGPLSDSRFVVALVNRFASTVNISFDSRLIGVDAQTTYSVRDLWAGSEVANSFRKEMTLAVKAHDIALLLLSPQTILF